MAEIGFNGRVAIITGAGRGIGRAHALLLAQRGAAVVVNDLGGGGRGGGSDATVASAVAEEIRRAGGVALADASDISSDAGAAHLVDAAMGKYGRVDIVINNAGIAVPDHFPSTDFDNVRKHVEVHVAGSYNVTRAAWPHMDRAKYGRVVMTISAAIFGTDRYLSYSVAKAGTLALARGLALLGRRSGILVNSVAPLAATRLSPRADVAAAPVDADADPTFVSALVALLAHESCPASGEAFTAGKRRFARLVLSETAGQVGAAQMVTPEFVLDHWREICDLAHQEAMPDVVSWAVSNQAHLARADRRGHSSR
jgi:NAD(P)-dependent dehydrogenase (short-subunit alcohol dehydrogenase family)